MSTIADDRGQPCPMDVDVQTTDLVEEIDQILNGDKKAQEDINLANRNLKTLPQQIGQLANVQWLRLYYNHLEELPEEMSCLTKLKGLYLQSNRLKRLPDFLSCFKDLQFLRVRANMLEEFPTSIFGLKNLREVTFSQNRITSLPKFEPNCLISLESLGLSFNKIREIPPEISNLTGLKNLTLDVNKISTLPFSICKLTNLTNLSLDSNHLKTLPMSIQYLTKLSKLSISQNEQLEYLPGGLINLLYSSLSVFNITCTNSLSTTYTDCNITTVPSLVDMAGSRLLNMHYFEQNLNLCFKSLVTDLSEKLGDDSDYKVCAACGQLLLAQARVFRIFHVNPSSLPSKYFAAGVGVLRDFTFAAHFCSMACSKSFLFLQFYK